MAMVRWFNSVGRAARWRTSFRCPAILLATLLLLVAGIVPASTQPPTAPANPALAARGEAKIAVMADFTAISSYDKVSIRLVNNTDRALLTTIAGVLARELHTNATGLTFKTGDPQIIKDHSIGLEFSLPVVPRNEGYLPVAPFVTAFAPYAAKLSIVYIIQGQFTYRGFEQYQQPDVSFTVDKPEQITYPVPFAFYGMNVMISNPLLGTMQIPKYPTLPPVPAPTKRPDLRVVLLIIAGVLGLAVGFFLVALLLRWKEQHPEIHTSQPTGEIK